MPELPEVEVIFRQLKKLIDRSTIIESRSYHSSFPKIPLGKIIRLWRHGKWLHLLMESREVIRINFGMSGRFIIGKRRPKHIRWAARFDTGTKKIALRFVDPRCFGHLEIVKGELAEQIAGSSALAFGVPAISLGPDLMSKFMREASIERQLSIWRRRLKSDSSIKQVLMQQDRLAGIGNIYSSELLNLAKIHPLRRASKLSYKQIAQLITRCKPLLASSIAKGGTSFGDVNTFRDIYSHEGQFSEQLRVYGRDRELCSCGGIIHKIKLDGRSTYFCSKCQR